MAEHPCEQVPLAITKRDRAKFLAHEMKSTVRGLVTDSGNSAEKQDDIYEGTAFNPQRALQHKEDTDANVRERLSVGVQTVKNVLKNPKAVSRNKYTRQTATNMAVINQETRYDKELIDAHDALADTKPALNQNPTSSEAKVIGNAQLKSAQERVQRVESNREDLKSAWILGRHVVRVKAVKKHDSTRTWTYHATNDSPDEPKLPDQSRYLGFFLLWAQSFVAHRIDDFDEPPFDLAELGLAFERLIVASTPFQSFFSKVRDVYCWKCPPRTARIMSLYWILWYFQKLGPFTLAWLMYSIIKSRIHAASLDEVRERVKRSQDQAATVQSWAELVQKHGSNEWIEPLADGIGPRLQMQVTDLAILLERLQNFYRWEWPAQTLLTSAFFMLFFVFLFVASAQACCTLLTFILGFCFFYSFPIATNYPKYRHVAGPLDWVFWGIPDDSELAIERLRKKVIEQDKSRLENNAHTADQLEFESILLPAHSRAQIVLNRTHIMIKRGDHPSVLYPYSDLLEMIKVDVDKDADEDPVHANSKEFSRSSHRARWLDKAAGAQLSPDGLGFVFVEHSSAHNVDNGASGARSSGSATGETVEWLSKFTILLNKSDRDKIFVTIIAWSGLKWQPLFSKNRQRRLARDQPVTSCKNKSDYGANLNPELDDAVKRGFT